MRRTSPGRESQNAFTTPNAPAPAVDPLIAESRSRHRNPCPHRRTCVRYTVSNKWGQDACCARTAE